MGLNFVNKNILCPLGGQLFVTFLEFTDLCAWSHDSNNISFNHLNFQRWNPWILLTKSYLWQGPTIPLRQNSWNSTVSGSCPTHPYRQRSICWGCSASPVSPVATSPRSQASRSAERLSSHRCSWPAVPRSRCSSWSVSVNSRSRWCGMTPNRAVSPPRPSSLTACSGLRRLTLTRISSCSTSGPALIRNVWTISSPASRPTSPTSSSSTMWAICCLQ